MRKTFLTLLTITFTSHSLILHAENPEKLTSFSRVKENNNSLLSHYQLMLKLQQRYETVKTGVDSLKALADSFGKSYLSAQQQVDLKKFETEKTKLEEKLKLSLAEYWRYPSSDLIQLNNKLSADVEKLKNNPEYSTANSVGLDFPLFNGENFSTTMSEAELNLAIRSINGASANLGAALATVTANENLQTRIGFRPARIKPAHDQAFADVPKED